YVLLQLKTSTRRADVIDIERPNRSSYEPGTATPRRRCRAALSVFARSIAMVIGPTPPGTGVSSPATPATASSTSPRMPDAVLVEHPHDTERSRGNVQRLAEVEQARVQRVEPVHVLRRIDRARDLRLVHVRWQGKLDEDPVDRVVRVQLLEELDDLVLRCGL